MSETRPESPMRPAVAAFLALLLLALGFVVGFGYQTLQSKPSGTGPVARPTNIAATATRPPGNGTAGSHGENGGAPAPPTVKGLHASPDDRLLALTAVYDKSRRASRFILDLKTLAFSAEESPFGWQDYITEWGDDGRSILFEREKIPQLAEEARAGLYVESVQPAAGTAGAGGATNPAGIPRRRRPAQVELRLPAGERTVAGSWSVDGSLLVRTRRETKALFMRWADGSTFMVDRSPATYYQHRAVRENGAMAYYVVRDVSGQGNAAALFRVQNGQTRKLTPDLKDVAWWYVAENGRWLIVCRTAANGKDWSWSLYRVAPQRAELVKQGAVPADVSAVYWSPDYKHVIGAWGKSLWVVDIPTLKVRRLGQRTDWAAQDVAWLHREQALIVAAGGQLWKVDANTGHGRALWKFPNRYWG